MLSHFPNLSISCLTANALLLKLLVQFVISVLNLTLLLKYAQEKNFP